jgi:hypothetical protein
MNTSTFPFQAGLSGGIRRRPYAAAPHGSDGPSAHKRRRSHASEPRHQHTTVTVAWNGREGLPLPWNAMTSFALATVLAALVLAVPAAAPADAASAAWPSKRDAHRLAVKVTAATCRELAWCQGSDVVSAQRCRRAAHQTVYCAIVFITAQRQRCGGVVGVSEDHRGRLGVVMAVPHDCSTSIGAEHPPL